MIIEHECLYCGSSDTIPVTFEFVFANFGGLDFFSVLKCNCRICGSNFHVIYRCHYYLTQKPSDEIKDGYHPSDNLLYDDRCPSCKRSNTIIHNQDYRYDIDHLKGIYGTMICEDCKNVFQFHFACKYSITRSRSYYAESRFEHLLSKHHHGRCTECIADPNWLLNLDVARISGRCPRCGNNGITPRSCGTHSTMDGRHGVHVTNECFKCHYVFEDVYVCQYVTTQDIKASYIDIEGRFVGQGIEYFACERCFFKWWECSAPAKDECPLCGANNPYPCFQE
jgi:hypothetical protein